ncbi:hypothetical protein MTX78_18855 [Hymenobacter tibetensis]|uniref:VWA domain-containing protein n=1 Tax=Hymenobacter tibetensis TaxID=497967 RepID=A0ABY4D2I9_9BACT|nr:hypothetical protein [Hymenobacter tibetensis]UOG74168.1 hypothetical protein MTX78_18855 [Hymenobacter tibetensis]
MALTSKRHLSFWACGLALLLSACDVPGEKRAASKVATAASPKTEEATTKTTGLRQLNVFVDISGGMQGFVRANQPGDPGSEFQRTVTALLSDVQGRTTQGTTAGYYFVKENPVVQPTSYAELSQTISRGIENPAAGTEMPDMLREVLKLQKPGTVSIIVSDFIYGPKDPTQTWRVRTDVKDALSTANPAELAVSVFANTSEFRGNFYPGNRTKRQTLAGTKLPYYVWVLGPAPLVAQVNQQLMGRLDQQPQVHFNAKYEAPTYGVVTGYQGKGEWYTEPGPQGGKATGVSFTSLSAKEPAQFVVGFDLKNLPLAARKSFSVSQLRLEPGNTDAKLVKTWAAAGGPPVPAAGRAYTHFTQISVSKLPSTASRQKPQTLRLALAPTAPIWATIYSTSNDSNIASQGPKTFLLTEVLAGVAESFGGQSATGPVLFDVPVALRRD